MPTRTNPGAALMSTPPFYTPLDAIPKIHEKSWEAWRSGKTKSIVWRKRQIAQVGYLLKDNEERIKEALRIDLGRHDLETDFFDFAGVYIDIRTSYDNAEKWTKKQRAEFNLNFFAMSPKLRAEPKGVVLIIAPFNFPVYLILSPLVGAIAAGNAAVIKPSEKTPTYCALLAELVPKYLDPELYHVINGGVPETTSVLELRWSHIFYIGNAQVARIISQAAAKHLTPLTLELGSQNPVVVDPKCDLRNAARRILWGRFSNAGQICLCPEYVLVPEDFQNTLVEALKQVYHDFYPEGPEKSDSFSRIISGVHVERLQNLITATKGTIVFGGDSDVSKRYFAPTLVRNVRTDDPLMEEEIFGPILMIVPTKSIDEAIDFINSRGEPLVIYVFSPDKKFQDKVFENTTSGAAVANETCISAGVPGLPMGGIGASGHGYFTGKFMFDEFTHLRVSLDNPSWVDKIAFGFRYPPYAPSKMLHALMPPLPPRPGEEPTPLGRWGPWLAAAVAVAASVTFTGPSQRVWSWFDVQASTNAIST
ncbi:NAD-aldehyde dehydrogenase [Trametes maxima]|nr:NAD-aldehyde dehydrogenase [Trametes maxima]